MIMTERFKLTPPTKPIKLTKETEMKYDFKKIKTDLLLSSEIEDGMSAYDVRNMMDTKHSDLRWGSHEVRTFLLQTGQWLVDQNDKLWRVSTIVKQANGTFFKISWQTNPGYLKEMNAKFLPVDTRDNGRYTRAVSSRNPDEIRNTNLSKVHTWRLKGSVYQGAASLVA